MKTLSERCGGWNRYGLKWPKTFEIINVIKGRVELGTFLANNLEAMKMPYQTSEE